MILLEIVGNIYKKMLKIKTHSVINDLKKQRPYFLNYSKHVDMGIKSCALGIRSISPFFDI